MTVIENKIKTGYKKTPVGIIPEDWDIKRLETQVIILGGNAFKSSDSCSDGVKWLKIANVGLDEVKEETIDYLPIHFSDKYKEFLLKKGDYVMALTRPILNGKLKIAKIKADNEWLLNQRVAKLTKKDSSLEYLVNTLKRPFICHELEVLMAGTDPPNLSLTDFKKLKLPIPPLPEQKAIADCLSTWDKGIEKLTALIQSKKEQKKGLMQRLLTGEKRLDGFTEEWEEVMLGAVAHITTGSSNKQDAGHNLEYVFFDRSSDVLTSDKYLFDCEAIIVPGEGADFIPKYFIGKFDLHQRAYSIMEFNNACGKFIYYTLLNNRKHLYRQAVGSTVKSLRLPNFTNMPLLLPDVEEQIAIAKVLTTADEEIELLEKKLDYFKTQKKGLMQVLLTGEKRLVDKN